MRGINDAACGSLTRWCIATIAGPCQIVTVSVGVRGRSEGSHRACGPAGGALSMNTGIRRGSVLMSD